MGKYSVEGLSLIIWMRSSSDSRWGAKHPFEPCHLLATIIVLVVITFLSGCSQGGGTEGSLPIDTTKALVTVSVKSDKGVPQVGTMLTTNGGVSAKTNNTGLATLDTALKLGEELKLDVVTSEGIKSNLVFDALPPSKDTAHVAIDLAVHLVNRYIEVESIEITFKKEDLNPPNSNNNSDPISDNNKKSGGNSGGSGSGGSNSSSGSDQSAPSPPIPPESGSTPGTGTDGGETISPPTGEEGGEAITLPPGISDGIDEKTPAGGASSGRGSGVGLK